MMKLAHYLIMALCLSACTAETLDIDSDGDGLSDTQESIFGTNPYAQDTDGDTLIDSEDPSPNDVAHYRIQAKVTTSTSTQEESRHHIKASVTTPSGAFVANVSLQASITTGQIANFSNPATGIYEFDAVGQSNGVGIVTLETLETGGDRHGESLTLPVTFKLVPTDEKPVDPKPNDPPIIDPSKPFELAEPGINPGQYANSGPMQGELWVMTIAGESLDWQGAELEAAPRAYVQVDLRNGEQIVTQTNAEGWVHIVDDRLNGPITLTVGAQGARYVTYAEVDARYISVGIHQRDILTAEADTRGGTVKGVVRGFSGECGVPAFPKENTNILGKFNIAIVQLGIRNTPLSSMNTGAILLPPDANSVVAQYFAIPPNLVLANMNDPSQSTFELTGIKPGKYIIFALAGVGSNIFEASQNPYRLGFEPKALGISEITIRGGESKNIEIDLDIDLTKDVLQNDIYFGDLPIDPETQKPLETGLILPMINTGKGVVFLDVNTHYNFPEFSNPLRATFPRSTHPVMQKYDLESHPMVVGLAGRAAVSGFDRPGISTAIRHPSEGEVVSMYGEADWLDLPDASNPQRPESSAFDAVSPNLQGNLSWSIPDKADLSIIRFNYMTPPIHNKILNSDIGSSRSHLLWEVFAPNNNKSIPLPKLSKEAPDYPVLVNYEPTTPGDAYQYGPNTIEFEINAYRMGPKEFDYNNNFLSTDVNMNAAIVSQDSWLFLYNNP